MVFSSLYFLYRFLPLTFLLYFIARLVMGHLRKRLRRRSVSGRDWDSYLAGKPERPVRVLPIDNYVLLAMSLFFYAWGEPLWILLLIASSFIAYVFSQLIAASRSSSQRKLFLVIAVTICLLSLGVFKYSGFFVSMLNGVTGLTLPVPAIRLPIGISFYTFQILSYVVDVYRGDCKDQRSYLNFLMYVSLFPQLIAGPIVRYTDIENQIENRRITLRGFSQGMTRFMVGLAKKVLIANYAGSLVEQLIGGDLSGTSVLGAWMGVIFYAIQIYFDFSGYSDMAIGLGKMFGFTFMENFNYPYICSSITDFWRRWHISLSTFFRDYVYIPLGGNRVGIPRQIFNLFVVWGLTGLWHGASWNFVLWGLYYFVFLCLEKFVLKKVLEHVPGIIRHIYSLFIVLIGWVIFYFTDFSKLGQAFSILFGFSGHSLTDPVQLQVISSNLLFLLLACVACLPLAVYYKRLIRGLTRLRPAWGVLQDALPVLYNTGILLVCTMSLVASTYNPFLYFRF